MNADNIIFIEMESRDAAFHFSLEEYLMQGHVHGTADIMMLWQVDPCVMLGNNQIAQAEVDTHFAQREGIQLTRRSSGGGAIYADGGTLFYTWISCHASPESAKEQFADSIVDALTGMGIPAKKEGRNDICVEGKKITGMAQYARHGRICTHGSLLYDTDLEKLACVLQPDNKKFQGKAVRSVRSRVGNVKDIAGLTRNSLSETTIGKFKTKLKHKLLHEKKFIEYSLTKNDIHEINKINKNKYANPVWTFGHAPNFTFHNSKRFPGGTVGIYINVEKGVVQDCAIRGDFLGIAPINELERHFIGKPFRYDALCDSINGVELQPYLGNISRDEFLSLHAPERKPDWLRLRHVENPNQEYVEKILRENNLNTVCREANCPNQGECFSQKTATFIIMGTHCTRSCRFCNIQNGPPKPLDSGEPQRVANAIKSLELKYAVITSVTRDDLPDGGAAHFAKTIAEIRKATPETLIEVLIPDFAGDFAALKTVTDATPDVISHNMETVASLYDIVRPQAGYRRSLEIIHKIKQLNPRIRTKSGIMLGMGETDEEIHAVMRDLREADCAILTIGQYLPPSDRHHRVAEYVTPQKFEAWGVAAREAGFAFVASAPLVRSSFRAGEAGKLLPLNGGIQ